jgi:peptidoglycan/xylan/chitin deacetylase (PgdA/CDA1 family)
LPPTHTGTDLDEHIVGTSGPDVILGRGGADLIEGRGGDDVICGGDGPDVLLGGGGSDLLLGDRGHDRLVGGAGNDRLEGSGGDDDLRGLGGRDHLIGGAGGDLLRGGDGVDVLSGLGGDDTLAAGGGDDRLRGGVGTDVCRGDAGADAAASCETVRSTEIGQRPPLRTSPRADAVALTFDDGPHPVHTYEVLGILAEYGVVATFFVEGAEVTAHPEVVAAVFAAGHPVQNHTCTHPHLTTLSDEAVAAELECADAAVRAAIRVEPRCYRPPSGMTDDRVRSVAAGVGLTEIMWDVNPVDWANPPTSAIVDRVLAQTDGGDIVLLHDGGDDRSNTVAALPEIIEALLDRGLVFESICG